MSISNDQARCPCFAKPCPDKKQCERHTSPIPSPYHLIMDFSNWLVPGVECEMLIKVGE